MDYVETPEDTPAGYQPPLEGPFRCGNCEYFGSEDSTCSKPQLADELGTNKVDSKGCCNFYEKRDSEMPISEYFKGKGDKVMKNMKKEYGDKKGKSVFYATANKKDLAGPSKKIKKKHSIEK